MQSQWRLKLVHIYKAPIITLKVKTNTALATLSLIRHQNKTSFTGTLTYSFLEDKYNIYYTYSYVNISLWNKCSSLIQALSSPLPCRQLLQEISFYDSLKFTQTNWFALSRICHCHWGWVHAQGSEEGV